MTHNIIIDTSIALENIEFVQQLSSNHNVFLTDIVLQELDGHKKSEGQTGYNAREFFRQLGKSNGEALTLLPDGKPLQNGDSLRLMTAGEAKVYVLVRKNYKTKNINDSKIIEVAKDYGFTLVTLDMAQKVRALSEGVEARGVKVESEKEKNNSSIIFLYLGFFILMSVLLLPMFIALVKSSTPIHDSALSAMGTIVGIGLMIAGALTLNKTHSSTQKPEYIPAEKLKSAETHWSNDPSFSSISGNIYHDHHT